MHGHPHALGCLFSLTAFYCEDSQLVLQNVECMAGMCKKSCHVLCSLPASDALLFCAGLAVLSFVEIALSKFCNALVSMWAMAHVLGWFQRHAAELPGTLNPRSLSSMQLPAQTGHLDQCNVDSLLSTAHNFLYVWPCIAPSPSSTAIGLYAVFAI